MIIITIISRSSTTTSVIYLTRIRIVYYSRLKRKMFTPTWRAKKDLYDFSNYPCVHLLYSDENKKVIGKYKDETAGVFK